MLRTGSGFGLKNSFIFRIWSFFLKCLSCFNLAHSGVVAETQNSSFTGKPFLHKSFSRPKYSVQSVDMFEFDKECKSGSLFSEFFNHRQLYFFPRHPYCSRVVPRVLPGRPAAHPNERTLTARDRVYERTFTIFKFRTIYSKFDFSVQCLSLDYLLVNLKVSCILFCNYFV